MFLSCFMILVSVVSGIIALLLFFSEIETYLSPNVSEELFVDTSRGHKLRINLDIIVPTISCDCKFKFQMYLLPIYIIMS